MRFLFLPVFLTAIFLFTQPYPASAQQNSSAGSTEISQAGIERLLKDLDDPQKLEKLKQDLRTLMAAMEEAPDYSETDPSGLIGQLLFLVSGYMQEVNQMLADAGRQVLQTPSLALELIEQAQEPEVLRTWSEMFAKVFLVLLAGLLAQWIVHRLLARARKSLEDQETYNKGLRFILLVGSALLDLIPIAAFAAAAYGLLPLLDPRTGTQLVALTLINANVLVRLILALARLVLVPSAPALRMLPLDNESVQYLYIWTRRVVRLGVYSYFILEAALILGLPSSLYVFLLKFLGLIIALMAVMLIMQNRANVTEWLRGDHAGPSPDSSPEPESEDKMPGKIQAVSVLRRRLADFWHVAVIVLIVGMFGTWALEIEGGFRFLASAIIMTAMVIALMTFLIRLSQRGLDHLFKISDELKIDHPELEARANRYLPLLRHTVKGILYLIAAFSIMQAWGMGTLSWLLSPQGGAILSQLLVITLIIAGALILWEVISIKVEGYLAKERQEVEDKKGSTRVLTLLPLFSNVVRIALILVAGMSVLAHLGINIAPLLAGAGVIGLAIGFGAQTLVRDVITGAFILMEDSIAVGDFVEAGGHAGTVEHLTVRTVTLRDLTGTVHVVPFGEVTTVQNYNRDYGYALVDAGVAYREDYGQVVQLLQDVAVELQQDETWGPDIIGDLEIFGLNNLGDSAVEIRVRLKTRPMRQFSVRRAFLERMKRIFDENGIEIPFPHQTIWFGTDKDGTAPPLRLLRESKKTVVTPQAIETAPQENQEEPKIHYFSESEASLEVVRDKEEADEARDQEKKERSGDDPETRKEGL